jgi:hypothetical protein
MIELVATIVITASSVLLFGYWFRYTCLLILSARTTRDYAGGVAAANQLKFPEVQAVLRSKGIADLDALKESLDRDYRVVTYLLRHSATPDERESALEKRMLEVNYRLMRTWYRFSRQLSPSAACKALEEMALVVAHFANSMGERATAAAAA